MEVLKRDFTILNVSFDRWWNHFMSTLLLEKINNSICLITITDLRQSLILIKTVRYLVLIKIFMFSKNLRNLKTFSLKKVQDKSSCISGVH